MSEISTSAVSSATDVVELNVGGVTYMTSRSTLLQHDQDSLLANWFRAGLSSDAVADDVAAPVRDSHGRYFIDRDGALFRYINDADVIITNALSDLPSPTT